MSDMREVLDELRHINRRLNNLERRAEALEATRGPVAPIDRPSDVRITDGYGDVVTFTADADAVTVAFPDGGCREVYIEADEIDSLITYLRMAKAYLT